MQRKITYFFFISCFLILSIFSYFYFFKKSKILENVENQNDAPYNSNIINDVNYTSKDAKGNEYIVNARLGEIDYSNSNINVKS